MAIRPQLSDATFLASVFRPSKNPIPIGLRKKKITGTRGRKPARVRAYNNLTAQKQEVLHRTGHRDAYLRGEVTLAQAKRDLRLEAEQRSIVKPLRNRQFTSDQHLAVQLVTVAQNRPERLAQSPIQPPVVYRNVKMMSGAQKRRAQKIKNYNQLYDAIQGPDFEDGDGYNLLWYK